ncbi:MAG: helix-turn-helix domain-containing protein [Gammaproteobacteria bacterium]|nr:helix-turn-helix domain-containing protein [Gammaproteobacteria bacterium]
MRQKLQTIKGINGKPEYILLPVFVYKKLHDLIDQELQNKDQESEYVDFKPEDFVKNELALMRMRCRVTQSALAEELGVSQAYISKIERDDYEVSSDNVSRVKVALDKLSKI